MWDDFICWRVQMKLKFYKSWLIQVSMKFQLFELSNVT